MGTTYLFLAVLVLAGCFAVARGITVFLSDRPRGREDYLEAAKELLLRDGASPKKLDQWTELGVHPCPPALLLRHIVELGEAGRGRPLLLCEGVLNDLSLVSLLVEMGIPTRGSRWGRSPITQAAEVHAPAAVLPTLYDGSGRDLTDDEYLAVLRGNNRSLDFAWRYAGQNPNRYLNDVPAFWHAFSNGGEPEWWITRFRAAVAAGADTRKPERSLMGDLKDCAFKEWVRGMLRDCPARDELLVELDRHEASRTADASPSG